MSLLLRCERAIQRYLLGHAAYLWTGEGEYVITDKGLKIRLVNGFEFFLPVLRGQDDVEATGPGVIAACPSATQVERGTLTSAVEVDIQLRYPADEGQNLKNALAAFEYGTAVLASALYRTDLPELLSEAENTFTCVFAPGNWTEESGWTDRLRTYRFRRTLIVSPTDFPEE